MANSGPILEALVKVVGAPQAAAELDKVGQSTTKVAGQLNQNTQSMQASGKAAEQTSNKFKDFGTKLQGNVGSLTAVTGSAWGMFNAIDAMEEKQLAANKAQTMAEARALALSKAQDKLAKMQKEGGHSAGELAKQQEVVRIAQEKSTQASERAAIVAGNLQEAWAQLATQIGPMAAALAGSVAQLIGNFSKAGPAGAASAAALAAQGPAGMAGAAGINAANTASKGLLATWAPLLIAIGAAAAVFFAVKYNLFGFRDALNSVGKALGDAIPFLKPILQLIQSLGVAVGMVPAEELGKGFKSWQEQAGAAFKGIQENINKFIQGIINIPKTISDAANQVGATIQQVANQVGTFVLSFMQDLIAGSIPRALNTLKTLILGIFTEWIKPTFDKVATFITDKLDFVGQAFRSPIAQAKELVKGFIDFILQSVGSIVPGIIDALSDLSTALGDALTEAIASVTKFADDVLKAFTDLFTKSIPALFTTLAGAIQKEIAKWITFFADVGKKILAEVSTWPDKIIGFFANIGKKISDLFTVGLPQLGNIFADFFKRIPEMVMKGLEGLNVFQPLVDAFWSSLNAIWSALTWLGGKFTYAGELIKSGWDAAVKWIQSAWHHASTIIAGKVQWLRDQWNKGVEGIKNIWNSLVAGASNVGVGISDAFNSTLTWMKSAFGGAVRFIQGIFTWKNFSAALGTLANIFAPILTFADQAVNYIKSIFTWKNFYAALGTIINIFTPILTFAQQAIDYIKKNFTWKNFWALIGTLADPFKPIMGFVDKVVKYIQNTFTWDNLAKGFKIVTDFFKPVQDAWDSTIKWIQGKLGFAQDIYNRITGFNWDNAWKALQTGFHNTIKNIVTDAQNFVKGVQEGLAGGMQKAAAEVKKGGDQIDKSIKQTGSTYEEQRKKALQWQTANVESGRSAVTVSNDVRQLSTAQRIAAAQANQYVKEAKFIPQVQNEISVTTAKMVGPLDITSKRLANTEYNLKTFAGAFLQLRDKAVIGLDGLEKGSARYLGSIAEQVAKYGMTVIETAEKANAEIEAHNRFWASIPPVVRDYINALQDAALSNIDVTKSLTDSNYATYLYKEGLIEGKKAVKDFIDENVRSRGVYDGTRTALLSTAGSLGEFGNAALMSNEQLQAFIGAAQMAPATIGAMASSIAGGMKQAESFIKFAGKEQNIFGNWHVDSTQLPKEMQHLFNKSTREMIAGQKRMGEIMKGLGPLVNAEIASAVASMDTTQLGQFAAESADFLRSTFKDKLGTAGTELANSLDAMAGHAKASGGKMESGMVPHIQRVITAMNNVNDPTAALMNKLMSLGGTAPGVGAAMMTMKGGLEQASSAGKSLTASLSELPLVTIKDNAGKVIAEFANLNGQLIPTKGGFDQLGGAAGGAGIALSQEFAAAVTHVTTILDGLKKRLTTMFTGTAGMVKIDADINPAATKLQTLVKTATTIRGMVKVDADINAAGQKLQSLVKTIVSIGQNKPKLDIDTSAAVKSLAALTKSLGGVKAGKGIAINVDTSKATKAISALVTAINNVKQKKAALIGVDTKKAHQEVVKIFNAINNVKQKKAVLISVDTAKALRMIADLTRKLNALPNINRKIVYTNSVPKPPNPSNIHRKIIYSNSVPSAPRSVSPETPQRTPVITPFQSPTGISGNSVGGGGSADYQAIIQALKSMKVEGDVTMDGYRFGKYVGKLISENNV